MPIVITGILVASLVTTAVAAMLGSIIWAAYSFGFLGACCAIILVGTFVATFCAVTADTPKK